MTGLEMALHNLGALAKCRRCGCRSCDRSGAGELHDHVCTQGEYCVDTREKMLQRLDACAIVMGQAREEIKMFLRQQAASRESISPPTDPHPEITDAMAEAAGRALAEAFSHVRDGLARRILEAGFGASPRSMNAARPFANDPPNQRSEGKTSL